MIAALSALCKSSSSERPHLGFASEARGLGSGPPPNTHGCGALPDRVPQCGIRYVLAAMGNLWFNRLESADRKKVADKIQAHAADMTKPPLLVFPEGADYGYPPRCAPSFSLFPHLCGLLLCCKGADAFVFARNCLRYLRKQRALGHVQTRRIRPRDLHRSGVLSEPLPRARARKSLTWHSWALLRAVANVCSRVAGRWQSSITNSLLMVTGTRRSRALFDTCFDC